MYGFSNFFNTHQFEIVASICSLCFMLFIIESIRKQLIKEAYSLIWVFMGTILIVLSLAPSVLKFVSDIIGIAYPPYTLSLVLITAILLILVQYSIVISKQTERIKELTQELSLLAEKMARLQERVEKLEKAEKSSK